jgi:CheY-like chemotaxis protein/signal transduction histidine kinase/CHASE3 domain sensor protein
MNRIPGWKTLTQAAGAEPVVVLSLSAVILFFVVTGALAYFNLRTISDDNDRISHSHDVIEVLQKVLSSAQDAETGQRGFLLTGSENYLQPYNAALADLPSQIDEIAGLTRGDPVQQRHVGPLRSYVATKLAELKQTIDTRRTKGLDAALSIVNTDAGKLSMDAIRNQLGVMVRQEESLRTRHLDEMAAAERNAIASSIVAGAVGIVLTLIVGSLVGRAAANRKRQEWLQSGQVGLEAAMRGDQGMAELGHNILAFLAEYFGAFAGAIYVADGETYSRVATYGVPGGADVPETFRSREGLLGEAAIAGKPLLIDDVPDGYLTFGSALGQQKPSDLIIAPGSVDGHVNTVLELGFTRPIDPGVTSLLEPMLNAIAAVIRSTKYRMELRVLFDETHRKSEELQVQGEELRVSNEELEEQSRVLKESQVRLQQQQAELEEINAQLEEQTQQLESQRDDLEKANAAVELKARELEQASRYKSDFLANMSHELRTPLNASLILAKLLADNPGDNLTAEQVKYAQTIQASGNDLLTLINDILDLSKIEAGHADIVPESLTVERLANDMSQLFTPIAQERRLGFTIDVTPECPPVVVTDPRRLEQILKNLLSNAFKFTEAGQVTLTVRRAGGNQVAFAVSDTGIGISPDQQQRIFDAFHQADGTISRRYGGTGLGLSISRELVRLLAGTLYLTSRPGEGSTFTVVIPTEYDPAKVAPRAAPMPAPAAPLAIPALVAASPAAASPIWPSRQYDDDRDAAGDAQRLLLVVEDDESFANILRDLSREMGFKVLLAATAEEALTLARQFMPSAIVLDIGLPDQSGLSVLDRLKRDVRTRHIPVHVVSASDHAQTALSLGAVGYMLKPVKREELANVLAKLEARLEQRMRRVLIVEDDPLQREAVGKLLTSHDVETVTAGTAAECLDLLRTQTFDCMVLDLTLPDASGHSLLESLSREEGHHSFPPVIVYTGRDLSPGDELRLRRYSQSIIIKGAKSPERLLDEVSLFLHQVVSELPDEQQKMIRRARNRDALLEGRRILIVEDDVRNVYALTNILEPRGASVEIARNGQEAIDLLDRTLLGTAPPIDLVLMDVMMPVMDGLTATRTIRNRPEWHKLPIITLTAKAMPDDQQNCIDAGANDYIAKPLDVEKLLSLVRVWMPR